MNQLCLSISRFALSAWSGAATLFVVTAIREVTSTVLDSTDKAHLAVMRFPAFYAFAFTLLGVAALAGGISLCGQRRLRTATRVLIGLSFSAFVLLIIDYVWIYRPLAEMTAAVQDARPASFVAYHRASMWINAAQLGASLAGAFLACGLESTIAQPAAVQPAATEEIKDSERDQTRPT